MSSKSTDLDILSAFGKTRRLLNLRATHLLRPLGIGPKQAVLMRELHRLKKASPCELSLLTQTDPAATGKILGTLIKKKWVKRTDHPKDRRQWLLSLTPAGAEAARKLNRVFQAFSEELCEPLSDSNKKIFLRILTEISVQLENCPDAVKDSL
jgi:DNA-binding MarR family transcriptional regulator